MHAGGGEGVDYARNEKSTERTHSGPSCQSAFTVQDIFVWIELAGKLVYI